MYCMLVIQRTNADFHVENSSYILWYIITLSLIPHTISCSRGAFSRLSLPDSFQPTRPLASMYTTISTRPPCPHPPLSFFPKSFPQSLTSGIQPTSPPLTHAFLPNHTHPLLFSLIMCHMCYSLIDRSSQCFASTVESFQRRSETLLVPHRLLLRDSWAAGNGGGGAEGCRSRYKIC